MNKEMIFYKVCTECKKIYKINYSSQYFVALVLFIMFFTMNFREDSYSLTTNLIITLITGLIFLGPTWYVTKDLLKKEVDCKVCNGKKTLIMLGTPKALETIKEYDLTIPEESPEEKKFPWQTS